MISIKIADDSTTRPGRRAVVRVVPVARSPGCHSRAGCFARSEMDLLVSTPPPNSGAVARITRCRRGDRGRDGLIARTILVVRSSDRPERRFSPRRISLPGRLTYGQARLFP